MEKINTSLSTDSSEPVLSIGVAAKKLGISPETLRLYERKGLVVSYKTESGHRLYSDDDLEWIACIRRQITQHKMNIYGLKRLLALIPCWDIAGCDKEEHPECPAYNSNNHVCWELEGTPCKDMGKECYTCDVYRASPEIERLKNSINVEWKL